MEPMALLAIKGDSGYADRARSYQVMLDGNALGRIGNGETKRFTLIPGRHSLRLTIDWCGSNYVEFEIHQGPDLFLQADSGLRGFKVFGTLSEVIFAPNSYILPVPESDTPAPKPERD